MENQTWQKVFKSSNNVIEMKVLFLTLKALREGRMAGVGSML